MILKIPQKIYRYQSFSAQSLEALCHDQIYFSDPSAFNDPLDCSPSIESDTDAETLRKILSRLIQKRVEQEILVSLKAANIEGDRGRQHAERQAQKAAYNELKSIAYQATNPEYEEGIEEAERWQLTYSIQRELLKQNNRGVCCLSEEYNNPLLWSHYSDQHNGFCVGYSLDRNPKPQIHKVIYGGSRTVKTNLIARAILDSDIGAQKELDASMLLRKAEPWGYEKEWRMFGNVGLQDSPLRLEEIIFGLRCSDAIMYSVMEALKPRDIKFYSMYVTRNSFELKRTDDIYEMCSYFPRTSYSGIEIFGPADSV
ncbi:DUF2971 domain-containing protein [Exilibacterium tricleocarpae]|uniref:DUF2971 domain-containing protein n=1 Tax=Exilibacterium tricleocarpae TaxID=2591008 RepID=A0A545TLA5_9GAMM|nr:DUF2971 domain-containing protein [Exilibacterium tricleocarpae]TQV78010.1 DUF2971 domain-containing protein [Exilibacterium tricleocarpae]